MKPQDILFIIVLLLLLWKRNPKWFVIAGLVSLLLAMPLFYSWIFFTAERFVSYAVAFLFIATCLLVLKKY